MHLHVCVCTCMYVCVLTCCGQMNMCDDLILKYLTTFFLSQAMLPFFTVILSLIILRERYHISVT